MMINNQSFKITEETPQKTTHNLTMKNRNFFQATGIIKVNSCDEYNLSAMTDYGTLNIGGKNICLHEINASQGEITVEGDIEYIQYSEIKVKEQNFFKRLVR